MHQMLLLPMSICLLLISGTPMDVDFDDIRNALLAVRGVKSIHNLGIWSLTLNKTAVAVHLVLGMFACHVATSA